MERLAELIRQLEKRVPIEVDEAAAVAGFKARSALSEELNQTMRRLRQCGSTEEVATWLVDSTSSFCGQAALFEVMENQVRGVRSRGFEIAGLDSIEELEVTLDHAAALAHTARERDTVVALGTPGEVSSRILNALAHPAGERVHLYPVVIQDKTVAILYALAGRRESVDGAALELLTHAAGMAAQILSEPRPIEPLPEAPVPALVTIKGVRLRANEGVAAREPLRREAIEARARWFARAEVARMQVFHRTAVERGRVERDIYSKLRNEIETARRTYQQDFLAVSPFMADYLHKELINLAHGDANLLGPAYPGSLV